MRKRIFEIIQIGNRSDVPSRSFDILLSVAIISNIISMFMQTFDYFSPIYTILKIVEGVTVIFFMLEYLLRIATADYLYPQKSKGTAVLRFMISFDGVIDLMTILPFFFLSGFVAFRILRVVRIFHLFRLNAKYDSFSIITTVIMEKRRQILSSVFIIFMLMLASSLGMYSAEHAAQPDVFKNAFSGIWWSVSTLLTVGYGDIYPITLIGRAMAILIAFLGVGAVAIPTGIISAGFVEQFTKHSNENKRHYDIKEIGEIVVGKKSSLRNLSVGEIRSGHDMDILLILRDDLTVVAVEDTRVKSGDILVVRSNKLVKPKEKSVP